MTIALQAADLDAARIDGTRIYLLELLKRFSTLSPETDFHLYHKTRFNPELTPPCFNNYTETALPFPSQWMQTRFALEMFRTRPEKIFFPVQAVPVLLPASSEVTITVHDLAWRHYPETFTPKTRFKLDFLLNRSVARADKIIAVSEATKQDLIAAFPKIDDQKIRVIHHGFTEERFGMKVDTLEKTRILTGYGLRDQQYILYVGALQPRKNLVRLIEAFGILKASAPEAILVLAGERAWLSDPIIAARERSPYRDDILLPGQIPSDHLPALYQGARAFAFPSLFEGFGIPILEAFASGTPVLTADNSSLPEVAGDAALYADAFDTGEIAEQLLRLWTDTALCDALRTQGTQRLKHFSWDTCARQTIDYILE